MTELFRRHTMGGKSCPDRGFAGSQGDPDNLGARRQGMVCGGESDYDEFLRPEFCGGCEKRSADVINHISSFSNERGGLRWTLPRFGDNIKYVRNQMVWDSDEIKRKEGASIQVASHRSVDAFQRSRTGKDMLRLRGS
jgi:hypothetical protein